MRKRNIKEVQKLTIELEQLIVSLKDDTVYTDPDRLHYVAEDLQNIAGKLDYICEEELN